MSEETKTIEKIRSGDESPQNRKIRLATEATVLAKAFVKAAFVDIQQEIFSDHEYSMHRSDKLLAHVERFKEAIRAHQSSEHKLTIVYCKLSDPPPQVASVRPGDLTPASQEAELLREFDLGDDSGLPAAS